MPGKPKLSQSVLIKMDGGEGGGDKSLNSPLYFLSFFFFLSQSGGDCLSASVVAERDTLTPEPCLQKTKQGELSLL